jgi:hypothetical protein
MAYLGQLPIISFGIEMYDPSDLRSYEEDVIDKSPSKVTSVTGKGAVAGAWDGNDDGLPAKFTLNDPTSLVLLPNETKKYRFVGSNIVDDTFPPAPRPHPSLFALQEHADASLLHTKTAFIESQRPFG